MSRHSAFETDTRGLLAGRGLFLLFNFYLQLSYDRLSFVSEITFFWTTATCAFVIFPCFPAFLVTKLLSF